MRSIRKGPEPRSLTDKETLRASLVAEQRRLCCYCLSRIPGTRGMKIEHWRSQTQHPLEQLDYRNLLGACMGNEGQPWTSQHCDTRKGDRALSRNPANPNHRLDDLRFLADGRIVSDDVSFDAELNQVLNLNYSRLKENRKATLDGFLRGLPKSGGLARAQLEKWLQEWNEVSHDSELRPFCQVVVYWLRKHLARL